MLLFVAYVLIPLVITGLMAFSDDNIIRFSIRGFSLHWFSEFFGNRQWLVAAANSLEIAAITALAHRAGRPWAITAAPYTHAVADGATAAAVRARGCARGFGGHSLRRRTLRVLGFDLYGSPFLLA